ncbi:hypothetical protein DL768_005890 [Monosporascus sp. mg162]|nr:hypothetical protein DL768_005890 [Monosporascus sp. mg162]
MGQNSSQSITSGRRSRPVPKIHLPRDWNTRDSTRSFLTGTRSTYCRTCGWEGDAASVFHSDADPPMTAFGETSTKHCFSCQIRTALIQGIIFDTLNHLPDAEDALTLLPTDKGDNNFDITCRTGWQPIPVQTLFTPTELRAVLGTRPPRGIPLRRLDIDTSSYVSSSWAQEQIFNCFQNHDGCARFRKQGGPSVLPTRLLDLDAFRRSRDIVLVHNSRVPDAARYVALSYCWGEHQPLCRTTLPTLRDRMKRIPWSTLPQTFKDAVLFTRSLRVRYLWIDAVCIIQGDAADWVRESGKMFDVYRNSYVTLAAGWGDSSTTGLFSTSSGTKMAELSFRGRRWPLYVRKRHTVEGNWVANGKFEELPLLRRAWTYQERLLSPRMLLFARGDLHFECFNEAACECGYTQDPLIREFSDNETKKQYFFRQVVQLEAAFRNYGEISRRSQESDESAGDSEDSDTAWTDDLSSGSESSDGPRNVPHGKQGIQLAWRNTVEDFSRLQLTNESDRLPAIGAIAAQFSKIRVGETYLAGLWSGSLLYDLLWQKSSESSAGSYWCRPWKPIRSGTAENAPSWSWAWCGVDIDWCYSGGRGGFDFRRLKTTYKADIVRAECSYKGNNPFGTLKSNKLVLRSQLLPCWLARNWAEWNANSLSDIGRLQCCSGFHYAELRCTIDMHSEQFFQQHPPGVARRVYLFLILKGTDRYKREFGFYLLLRAQNRRRNIFKRVGLVRWEFWGHTIQYGASFGGEIKELQHCYEEHRDGGADEIAIKEDDDPWNLEGAERDSDNKSDFSITGSEEASLPEYVDPDTWQRTAAQVQYMNHFQMNRAFNVYSRQETITIV